MRIVAILFILTTLVNLNLCCNSNEQSSPDRKIYLTRKYWYKQFNKARNQINEYGTGFSELVPEYEGIKKYGRKFLNIGKRVWRNISPRSRPKELSEVEKDVNFLLWTNENPYRYEKIRIGNLSMLNQSHFQPDLPTKILIHGFQDTGTTGWVRNVTRKYFEKESCNVISVDWRKLAFTYPFYNIAAANTKSVGFLTASLIEFLIQDGGSSMSLIHPIGFSLGAQVAGHLGYKLQGKLPRITGLDPAGFLFHNVPHSERLDPSDALFVDVIHSAGLWIGMDEAVGHVDFYPNQGRHPQPGCEEEGLGLDCSHQRAHKLFAESINSAVGFLAFKCDSWHSFSTRTCDLSSVEQNMMGEPAISSRRGVFYLRTNSSPPFAINSTYIY